MSTDLRPLTPPSSAPPSEDAPWQRLHPLTPWLRGWVVIVALVGYTINTVQNYYQQAMELETSELEQAILYIILAIIGVFLLVVAYNFIWWRMARFRITADAVESSTGILFRRNRSLRLDQLEAVDIVHPVVARIFGLVELKLEAAGGADSYLSLAYLTASKAEAVRSQILSRRTGPQNERTGPQNEPPPGSPPSSPQNTHLFRVPVSWTIRAYLRTWQPWTTAAGLAASAVFSIWAGTWSGMVAILPLFYAFARVFWNRIVTEMGFTGYVHPEGIRLTHGLLTQINQTIPASRIQAVRLRQRLWWRGPDWWRIDLNVAGYGLTNNENRTVLVPVADPIMAATAVTAVMPGAEDIWAAVDRAMHATNLSSASPRHCLDSDPASSVRFTCTPRRARILDPVTWAYQGYAETSYALVIRTGRLTRTVTIVPHNRIQGITCVTGPWANRLGLASVGLHSTQGPIDPIVPHLDQSDAAVLLASELPRVVLPPSQPFLGPDRTEPARPQYPPQQYE